MRLNKIICFIILGMLALTSCVERGAMHEGEGYLDLSVTNDENVEIVPVTKAEAEPSPVALTLFDSKGQVAGTWSDVTQITEPVALPTGEYKAVASSGEDAGVAAFDSPFYTGIKEFRIRPNVMTTVDLVCKLASVKVTADISQQIKDSFRYSLTVSNGQGSLLFDEGNIEREGYFSPTGSLSWTLALVNARNERFEVTDTYTGVSACQHYALSFSIEQKEDVAEGAAEFRIIVDDSFNDPKTHDVVVVIDKSAPSVSGPDDLVRYVDDPASDCVVELNTTLPMETLIIEHDDMGLASAGLPVSSDLMSMTDFSVLTEAGVAVEIIDASGNPQQAIDAQTGSVILDFTSLAGKTGIGVHSFRIIAANASRKEVYKDVRVDVRSSFGGLSTDPWAAFIYLKAKWLSENTPSGFGIQYREAGSAEWTDVEVTQVTMVPEAKECRAFILGLTPSASYEVRMVSANEQSSCGYITTESAPQLYNLSFDDWCTVDGAQYPYASGADPKIWDTANGGTKMMSVYPTVEEKSDVVSGSAARMESTYASMVGIGKFAAGNIYTGSFGSVSLSPMGATLKWGVPFTGRPVGLKGWYKYAPKPIDYVGSGYEHLKGQSDICQVQVALMDWSAPADINTATNQFVDFSDANKTILAHKDLLSETTDGSWVPFLISTTYRDVVRKPSYIVISACASRYGDYFTGGKGSVMLIDEFELVYDPMKLSEDDRQEFFSLFD